MNTFKFINISTPNISETHVHANMEFAFDCIPGESFYKNPLSGINDRIRVLDATGMEVPYKIYWVFKNKLDQLIMTIPNENNRGKLVGPINEDMAKFCPKYEHYIDFSSRQNFESEDIYFAIDAKYKPTRIICTRINLTRIRMVNGISVESAVYP